MDIDTLFEAQLLAAVDEFLRSDADWKSFLEFAEILPGMLSQRFSEALEPFERDRDYIARPFHEGNTPDEHALILRLSDAVMPHERARYFDDIAERMSYTIPTDPDAQGRHYGYGNLAEFIEFVRMSREGYRGFFGL